GLLATSLRDARSACGDRRRRTVDREGGNPVTTDRDIAPIVRSWLRDEPDASAEHVLDRALAVVDLTPQRPAARWPARSSDMNLIVRLGVAAAVLAMAVVIGYSVIQNVGSSAPDPSTGPSAPG